MMEHVTRWLEEAALVRSYRHMHELATMALDLTPSASIEAVASMLAQHLTVVIDKAVADADYLRQATGLFNELQRALQTHEAVALCGADHPINPIAPAALAPDDCALIEQRA